MSNRHYIQHLSSTSVEGSRALVEEDIYNEFGVLLLKRGNLFGPHAASQLTDHKLTAPIDELLRIPEIDAYDVLPGLTRMLREEHDLQLIAAAHADAHSYQALCSTCQFSTAIKQRLAVLEQKFPAVFQRALFCAWLGSLVASEQGLPEEDLQLVFKAALVHDLGLLEIEPALVDKKAHITAKEWQQIQRHPQMAANLIKQHEPENERLLQIILDHHERCDGAGYPNKKLEENQEPLAEIIAVCGMLYALRFNNLDNGSVTLGSLIPYLSVNSRTYGLANYRTLVAIFQHSPRPANTDTDSLNAASTADLTTVLKSMDEMRGIFEELISIVGENQANSEIASIRRIADQAHWALLSSGITSPALRSLLTIEEPDTEDPALLSNVNIVARETLWLVRKLLRQLVELPEDAMKGIDITLLAEARRRLEGQLKHCELLFSS